MGGLVDEVHAIHVQAGVRAHVLDHDPVHAPPPAQVQASAVAVAGEAALGGEGLGHGRHPVADERADVRPFPGPLAGVHAGAERPLDDRSLHRVDRHPGHGLALGQRGGPADRGDEVQGGAGDRGDGHLDAVGHGQEPGQRAVASRAEGQGMPGARVVEQQAIDAQRVQPGHHLQSDADEVDLTAQVPGHAVGRSCVIGRTGDRPRDPLSRGPEDGEDPAPVRRDDRRADQRDGRVHGAREAGGVHDDGRAAQARQLDLHRVAALARELEAEVHSRKADAVDGDARPGEQELVRHHQPLHAQQVERVARAGQVHAAGRVRPAHHRAVAVQHEAGVAAGAGRAAQDRAVGLVEREVLRPLLRRQGQETPGRRPARNIDEARERRGTAQVRDRRALERTVAELREDDEVGHEDGQHDPARSRVVPPRQHDQGRRRGQGKRDGGPRQRGRRAQGSGPDRKGRTRIDQADRARVRGQDQRAERRRRDGHRHGRPAQRARQRGKVARGQAREDGQREVGLHEVAGRARNRL
jgi:hypothetical protein